MSLLKQISDKGAVLSWSPISNHANLVALGTKDSSGVSFDDYGGELEIHSLDFANTSKTSSDILGKAKTSSRFASISWSEMATNSAAFPFGLIAGGMIDGSIHIWDSNKLVQGNPESLSATVQQHQGAIHGLQFNPHKESSHLLASGGSDGEVYVMALDRPDTPNVFIPAPPPNSTKHTADITKISWNSQVAHILASSSQNGSTIVWDLRQKKAWCELREPAGGSVSDVAWNPDQGLHLVTASGDDKNPVIKLWDLRSSTSLPLATLQGHTEGVLSVSWCPADSSFLMSSGKDNQTFLWDLFHLKPVYVLPSERARDGGDQGGFGGLASSAVQKRFHVSWSPCLPAVVAACSFDRRVQFYSLSGAKSSLGRAPKWLRTPVQASFGFGGKLVCVDNKPSADGLSGKPEVTLQQREEDPTIGAACDLFHSALASGDFKSFCDAKAGDPRLSVQDRGVWSLMRVICFEKNAREELLTHLGFDNGTIALKADEYVRSRQAHHPTPPPLPFSLVSPTRPDSHSAEDLFSGSPVESPEAISTSIISAPKLSPEVALLAQEMATAAMTGLEAEPTIRQALVVGNFAAAVECCLEAGLMAEALLLAQCGDPALCSRTQAVFFQRHKDKKPFLQILHAIIKGELMEMVQTSDLARWKETLALLSTYGKSEEFPVLCETIAARLETEVGDIPSATLCYMCATNVERVVHFWAEELSAANADLGKLDCVALQQFVEKVVVYTHANPVEALSAECSAYFSQYAALLASQGRLDVAHKYLRGNSNAEAVLRDRIYHATVSHAHGEKPPPFPFDRVEVREAQARTPSKPTAQSYTQPQTSQPLVAATGGVKPVAQAAHPNVTAVSSGVTRGLVATPTALPPQPITSASTLPPGWTQLLDPTSGRPYYVNQSTGTSQWELPAPLMPTPPQYPSQPTSAPTQVISSPSPAAKPAPYIPAARPISAAALPTGPAVTEPAPAVAAWTLSSKAAPPPVSATPQQRPPAQPLIELASVTALEAVVSALTASTALSPADKRQVSMVVGCLGILKDKAGRGEVSAEVQDHLDQLVLALQTRNFAAANAVQTVLANTAWQLHKDWIKGIKVLIQILASKK